MQRVLQRLVFWSCLISLAALALVWVTSLWYEVTLTTSSVSYNTGATVIRGQAFVSCFAAPRTSKPSLELTFRKRQAVVPEASADQSTRFSFSITRLPTAVLTHIHVPLWAPMVLLSIWPTACVFRRVGVAAGKSDPKSAGGPSTARGDA